MNAIPPKPLEADPAAGYGGKSPASRKAGNAGHMIEFTDEPEDTGTAAGSWQPDHEGTDKPAAAAAMAARTYQAENSRADAAFTPDRRTPPPVTDQGEAPVQYMPPQLAGIEVTLTVEIGSHRLPLKDLLSIDPGQLFALDRMTTEPVSILVNGKSFARGEIVAIGDRFGVRILDIPEPEAC